MKFITKIAFLIIVILLGKNVHAEDGYKLWLRYAPVSEQARYESVKLVLDHVYLSGNSSTMEVVKEELIRACEGMLGIKPEFSKEASDYASLIIGTPATNKSLDTDEIRIQLRSLGPDGYYMGYLSSDGKGPLILAANTDVGALYGTVERGYAGFSIWNWHKLPRYIDPRYVDYARANASIGINGSVVTNVNANAFVLTPAYLEKVAECLPALFSDLLQTPLS